MDLQETINKYQDAKLEYLKKLSVKKLVSLGIKTLAKYPKSKMRVADIETKPKTDLIEYIFNFGSIE